MPRRLTDDDLEHRITRLLSNAARPLGAGMLQLLLSSQGIQVSMPTVGRRLLGLEHRGIVAKAGVNGRILTDHGLEYLEKAERQQQVRLSSEALAELLRRGSKDEIVEVLVARRAVERQAAELAARNASSEEIERLRSILAQQDTLVQSGELAIDEDIEFHVTIAAASHNSVLHALVSLLRNHYPWNELLPYIRSQVGGRLVVDHAAILGAIERRGSAAAAQAIDRHIQGLIRDVEAFWAVRFGH